MLSKLAAGPLRLANPAFRPDGAVAALAERLARLDAAREIVAARAADAAAKRNGRQAFEKAEGGETGGLAAPSDP